MEGRGTRITFSSSGSLSFPGIPPPWTLSVAGGSWTTISRLRLGPSRFNPVTMFQAIATECSSSRKRSLKK